MSNIEKFQTLIILLAVGTGLLLGQVDVIKTYAEYLIVPSLAAMLYGLFLSVPIKDLKGLLKTNALHLGAWLLISSGHLSLHGYWVICCSLNILIFGLALLCSWLPLVQTGT